MRKPKPKPQPKLFIGSSAESLEVAYAIQENLEPVTEPTVWPQGVFELSKTAIESLSRTLSNSDFGIFVFAPNDILRLRKKTYAAVRDNVIFELGLFVGRLGIERTFIVMPRNVPNLRIPTDLAGITTGLYNAQRQDGNLQAALGPACNQIRKAIKKLKPVRRQLRKRSTKQPAQGTVLIQKALYGGGENWIDVGPVVARQLRNSWRIIAGNELAGDPSPGEPKKLQLNFKHAGRHYETSIPEGHGFSLPGSIEVKK